MVGVPGRSKACHNCRRRRIRCGGERPGCDNCTKSNRTCTGYQKKHAFILSKEMIIGETLSSESLPGEIDESESGIVLMSRWRIDKDEPLCLASKSSPPPSPVWNTYLPMIQDIPPRNVFRDKLLSTFLEYHLPLKAVDRTFEQRHWLSLILDLPTLTPALENAILALCTARLGRYDDHQSLIHKSLSLYTNSLRVLRQAVINSKTQCDEQNIAACMALALYEVSECPGRAFEGYLSHYNGAMKLVQIRGANAHRTGLAHSMFQALRRHSIFLSLRLQCTTFLAEPKWRELPWASFPASKSPMDRLLDILLQIPSHYTQGEALETAKFAQETFSKTIQTIQESLRLDSLLNVWFTNFNTTISGPLYYPKLSGVESTTDSPELGKLFPVSFYFPAFSVAQALVFYWIAQIIVHAHVCMMYDNLSTLVSKLGASTENLFCTCDVTENNLRMTTMNCLLHFSMDLLPPLGHKGEWPRTSARNICQSVEYFLQEEIRGDGPVFMFPALATVKGYWRFCPGNWSREICWIDEMVRKIQDKGNEIAGYI